MYSMTLVKVKSPSTIRLVKLTRVVPDTDLAGYPANNLAGYRISGTIVDIASFFFKFYRNF